MTRADLARPSAHSLRAEQVDYLAIQTRLWIEPADFADEATVTRALRVGVDADAKRSGSVVSYGGSAGPGLLTRLDGAVDGLFLGRFAQYPSNLHAVLDEAAALAAARIKAIT